MSGILVSRELGGFGLEDVFEKWVCAREARWYGILPSAVKSESQRVWSFEISMIFTEVGSHVGCDPVLVLVEAFTIKATSPGEQVS